MSWQEELRRLDEELASGRLSADDYRIRRDQVLSSAVAEGTDTPEQQHTGPAGPAGQQPKSDSTQVIAPVNPSQGAQQPNPSAQQYDAERTQAVPAWQAQPPVQYQPGPSSPAGGFAHPGVPSPSGGFQQPAQPWNAPSTDASPPWGGGDFPPIAATNSGDWAPQGPEGFDDGHKGGKGKVVAIALAVLLVVGGGLTAFLIWGTGGGNSGEQAQTSQQQQPPPSAAPPTSPQRQTSGPLVIPDGETPGPKTYTGDELAESKSLPEPDLVVIKENDVTSARSVFSTDGTTVISVWAFKTAKPEDLLESFEKDQQRFGFEKASDGQNGIQIYSSKQKNNDRDVRVFRAHYVSDSYVIRVEAFDTDEAQAQEKFDAVLEAQTEHLAPAS